MISVWGSSASDVFAVGTKYAGGTASGGVILHYDGSAWSAMDSSMTAWLSAVWGSSGSDVFALGGDDTKANAVFHYDGFSWSAMKIPTSERLRGIGGDSATDMFAVGDTGTIHATTEDRPATPQDPVVP